MVSESKPGVLVAVLRRHGVDGRRRADVFTEDLTLEHQTAHHGPVLLWVGRRADRRHRAGERENPRALISRKRHAHRRRRAQAVERSRARIDPREALREQRGDGAGAVEHHLVHVGVELGLQRRALIRRAQFRKIRRPLRHAIERGDLEPLSEEVALPRARLRNAPQPSHVRANVRLVELARLCIGEQQRIGHRAGQRVRDERRLLDIGEDEAIAPRSDGPADLSAIQEMRRGDEPRDERLDAVVAPEREELVALLGAHRAAIRAGPEVRDDGARARVAQVVRGEAREVGRDARRHVLLRERFAFEEQRREQVLVDLNRRAVVVAAGPIGVRDGRVDREPEEIANGVSVLGRRQHANLRGRGDHLDRRHHHRRAVGVLATVWTCLRVRGVAGEQLTDARAAQDSEDEKGEAKHARAKSSRRASSRHLTTSRMIRMRRG